MYRIGFDVGGTFTDFTLQDTRDGGLIHIKLPSTPADPSRAIAEGLGRLLSQNGVAPDQVGFVGHGTTVATNMVIERRGAKTGLITTMGCRDVLEIGRQTRPALYDYDIRKPEPLVPRRRRYEVSERLDARGEIIIPLDHDGLEHAVSELVAQGVEAIAVCFLHSYARAEHEERARQAIMSRAPNLYISLSSEILPEFREYERTSTTVLNAYVGPRMADYLARFGELIAELGIPVAPYTIHSNGGVISIRSARDCPVRTCLSGPAAGVVGAARIASEAGYLNAISFDVGGTSTDVSLIRDGQPLFTSDRSVAEYPIKCPMIDVHVIGAGGGSIAKVDDAGALTVGPKSAGASPGPAAYALGGTQATLTDANLVLGRLNPTGLIAGDMPLAIEVAREAVDNEVAAPLGMDVAEAADGIITVAVSNMSRAIRSVSTERGHDLAEFSLIAYGGAGPLHATAVARDLGIRTVIVPVAPGTLCARGILISNISLDFVGTVMTVCDASTWREVGERFHDMQRKGEAWLASEDVTPERRRFDAVIDARYHGQNHEVAVTIDDYSVAGLGDFYERFAGAHVREHGYELPGHAVEIVNCRLKAVGATPHSISHSNAEGEPDLESRSQRPVYHGPTDGWIETPIFGRARLSLGAFLTGPCVVEEMSATTLISPGQSAVVDEHGNIIIGIGGGDDG